MVIAAAVSLVAAAVTAALGIWSLVRPGALDPAARVLRSVAPVQLAAAVMLTAGAIAALTAGPSIGLLVLSVCIVGAVGTVAAGCYQSAKVVAASEAGADATAGCAGSCASCSLSCK